MRLRHAALPALALLALCFGLTGLGGCGGTTTTSSESFEGGYLAIYSGQQATGTILVSVDSSGVASLAVVDGTTLYTGVGTISALGTLSGTASLVTTSAVGTTQATPITVFGLFNDDDGTISGTINLSGPFTVGGAGVIVLQSTASLFAASYTGTSTGTYAGDWSITVGTDSSASGTAFGGDVSLTGSLMAGGAGLLTGSGTVSGQSVTVSWTGTWYPEVQSGSGDSYTLALLCEGTWSGTAAGSAVSGAWTGNAGTTTASVTLPTGVALGTRTSS